MCSEVTLGDNPYRSKDFQIQVAKRDSIFRCGCIVEEIIYSKETKLYLKYRFSFYIQFRENLKLYFPWDSQNGQQTQIQEEYHEKTIITVVGNDTVGIIAKVCTYLAQNQVNILDISQTIVQGYFNMMMVADTSASDKEIATLSKELAGSRG